MPDDDREPPLKRFIAELNKIWTAAGPPTFAEVEVLSAKFTQPVESSGLRVRTLTRSTTQGILAGRRRTLPQWPWVASFVTVLRAIAAQNGVDPDTIGTLEEWKAKHAEADATLRRVKAADQAQATAVIDLDEEVSSNESSAQRATSNRRLANAGGTTAAGPLLTYTNSERDRRASVLALLRRVKTLGWWHHYHEVVPEWFEIYLSLEPAATLIRSYETQFVPDLLQTEDYARAAIRLDHNSAPTAYRQRHVELRMQRQQILNRPDPAKLWIILDERVLRHCIGGAATMRAQIDHLLAIAQRTNITIQVMLNRDTHSVAGGSISVLRFRERELPDVAYLRHSSRALYPSEESDMIHYRQVLDSLALEAANPTTTVEFLHRMRADI